MLKMEKVTKTFKKQTVLKDLFLCVENGKLYLFVGPNGSGKTTTIRLIVKAALLKKKSGRIFHDFPTIAYLADKRAYPLLLYVETFLKYYLPSCSQEEISRQMQRYGVENKKIHALSKGMIQKMGLIQTLMQDRALYVLDEPEDGIDEAAMTHLKEDLDKLLSNGKTVIISTHHPVRYEMFQPIVYTFKEGRCFEEKPS